MWYSAGMDTTLRPRRDFAGLKARRMRAAALFEEGKSQAEVVHLLDVSRQTASRWFDAWKRKGKAGLQGAGRAGRRPKVASEALARLEKALVRGPTAYGYATQMWTLERIAHVIEHVCHVRYHPGHVWRILGQLGWSCQRPEHRAKERDEAAIHRWIREDLPRIKKNAEGGRP